MSTFTPICIYSQEGFSKKQAPAPILSMAPQDPHDSQVLSIWLSRCHPLCPTRPCLQGLRSATVPPNSKNHHFASASRPFARALLRLSGMPFPLLGLAEVLVRGQRLAQRLFPGRGRGGCGQVPLPLAPSLPSLALPWGPSLTFFGWLWSTLPGSSLCLTYMLHPLLPTSLHHFLQTEAPRPPLLA